MTNVISWTETEISVLVQAWSEVEAKYPLMRCPRGGGSLHAKVYALFSKKCAFARSSSAVNRMKQAIRIFVLFVHKFNEDRRQAGDRQWFDLRADERRAVVPTKFRGLATTVNHKTFAKLMTMERAQRWLGEENAFTIDTLQDEEQELRPDSSFISPLPQSPQLETAAKGGASYFDEFSLSSEASTPSTEQGGDKVEKRQSVAMAQPSHTNPSSLFDDDGELSSSSSPSTGKSQGNVKSQKFPTKLKHRDCNILLENMMKLQNKKMRRAVAKLRADIEEEIQRSSEMLHSIISDQFDDPGSSGDVAFMTKVLNMQQQQVRDRFDQFEEKRTREEAANRALIG